MRILSGIQPSGRLHLGNYFGMMRPAIELQEKGEAFYFIADYHALTSIQNPGDLRRFSREVAMDLLAAGLDPGRSALFRQSDVPEVTELSWILSTVTPMGLLQRCHSYKDKVARGISASHGLFAYPVLMAADILIYDSDLVPVGRDQKQHVEVARDIAIKFNEAYGEVLRMPEPEIRDEVAVVPGLDGQKMSKSYDNGIYLSEPEASFRKKVMGIKTDSTPVEAPKAVEGSLILQLYRLVATEGECRAMEASFLAGGTGYGEYKKELFRALWGHFAEYRRRRAELEASPARVDEVLAGGAARARSVARAVLGRVREAVGLC
ncbi:MAG: tryptophan--tRNA ligase [Verrucomicrobiae bacterium]|nr:tryptophan--tRNA ligase [Verrucomicrobiae bacterium]